MRGRVYDSIARHAASHGTTIEEIAAGLETRIPVYVIGLRNSQGTEHGRDAG